MCVCVCVCSDHLFHLNFAITLFNNGDKRRSKNHFKEFDRLFQVGGGEGVDEIGCEGRGE